MINGITQEVYDMIGRIFVWLVELFLGILLVLLFLVLLLPTLLSTTWSRKAFLPVISKQIGLVIEVDELELGWWNRQAIGCLKVYSLDGTPLFSCNRIKTEANLWQILFGNHSVDLLTVEAPIWHAHIQPFSKSAFESKFDDGSFIPNIRTGIPWKKLIPSFYGQIDLTGGAIYITGESLDPVNLEDLTLHASLPNQGARLSLDLSGKTQQNAVAGTISLQGTLDQIGSDTPLLYLKSSITSLPVLGIDQLVSLIYPSYPGIIHDAVGPSLDLELDCTANHQQFNLLFSAYSPQFNGFVHTITQDGKISLTKASRFSLTLTPNLVNPVFRFSPLMRGMALSNSPQAILEIDHLEIPVKKEEGIAWEELSADAHFTLLNLQFGTPALLQGVEFDRFKGSFHIAQLQKDILFNTETLLRLGDSSALISASGAISDIMSRHPTATFAMTADQFPTHILDEVVRCDRMFQDFLGSSFDLKLAVDRDLDQHTAILYFLSPTINLADATFLLGDQTTLLKPATLRFSPPPTFWQTYTPKFVPSSIELTLTSFQLPQKGWERMNCELQIQTPSLNLNHLLLSRPVLSCSMTSVDKIETIFRADGLQTSFSSSYNPQTNTFALLGPWLGEFMLTPAQFTALLPPLSSPPLLKAPTNFQFRIEPFKLQTGQDFLRDTQITGKLSLPLAEFSHPSAPALTASFRDSTATWKLDTAKGEFSTSMKGLIAAGESTPSLFQLSSLARKLHFLPSIDLSEMEVSIKTSLEELNTAVLDTWTGKQHPLSPLLGKTLTLKGEFVQSPNQEFFQIDASSNLLQIKGGLAKEEEQIVLKSSRQPVIANWTLTPEGLKTLLFYSNACLPVTLQEPCKIEARCTNLVFPLQMKNLSEILLDTSLRADQIHLLDSLSSQKSTLQHFTCNISRPLTSAPLSLWIKSAIAGEKAGLIDLQADVDGIASSPQGWNFDHLSLNMGIHFQQVPSALFDLGGCLAGLHPQTMTALFGQYVTGSFQTHTQDWNGTLSLQINTPATRASLEATLEKGVLVLKEPCFAQITMTEALSRVILKGVNPLSISAISSQGPMTVAIDPQGFSLPIYPWNLSAIQIDQAKIELGKINCRNEGNLQEMLGLLKLEQFSSSNSLNLWFAPMDISMKAGVIKCERTEILVANSLEIATWGKVDLVKDQVKATLGITAQALKKAFGVSGLPESYVLQLPMRGPIDNVKIDTSKATANIAAILAWKHLAEAGGLLGGPQGAAIGGLLGKLSKLPGGNQSAPPAKHPFPWEAQPPPSKLPPKKRKNAIKPGDKPLKQLLKLIR